MFDLDKTAPPLRETDTKNPAREAVDWLGVSLACLGATAIAVYVVAYWVA